MRVWIFNQYATSPKEPGGTRHFSLAKALVMKGHEVTIFASSFHYSKHTETQQFEESSFWKEDSIEGVQFIWFKTIPYKSNNWRRYLNILDYTYKIKMFDYSLLEKPDVIIGSSFHLLTPWISGRLAQKLRVPFVSEIRDLWPETLIALGTSKYHPLVLLMAHLEKRIYRSSSRIIVLFPKAHEYILNLRLGISRDDIVQIPNGVDCRQFAEESTDTLVSGEPSIINKRSETLTIVNAGSLGNVYCLDSLLDAMKILQDTQIPVHLYLVGDGVKAKELKKQAQELRLENVTFHEPVSREQIPALLSKADILYASIMDSPLYRWGMSLNKITEYMAAAKPIVFGYNQPDNPINESGCGFTVPANQPKALAEVLQKLVAMTETERKTLGKRGRLFAEKHYDFSILGEKLTSLLETVVKENT